MASGETQHEPPSNNANNAPTTSALNHANRPSTTGHTVVDPALILRFGAKQIISLFIPVSICMFAVVVVAKSVPYFAATDVYLIYTPFHTPNADVGTQTWQTLANVAIFLGVVIVMTFLLVLLVKFKCYKCLSGWLIATTFLLVFVISFIFFTEVLRSSMIFFDNITFAILLWNFGVLGLISIHWKSPLIVRQTYLVFNSVQLALIFLKYLPKWTCWVLLGALAIWDLIAVLCPRGPLRMLVELSQEHGRPLLPAMIYSTTSAFLVGTATRRADATQCIDPHDDDVGEEFKIVHLHPEADPLVRHPFTLTRAGPSDAGEDPPQSNNSTQESDANVNSGRRRVNYSDRQKLLNQTPPLTTGDVEPRSHEMRVNGDSNRPEDSSQGPDDRLRCLQEDMIEREERGVKLGLGDFIFYSLLIGRAALDGDMLTIVACYVAILVGMCLTIVALGVSQKALPALPISVACGILFYFTTAVVITPFITATSYRRFYF